MEIPPEVWEKYRHKAAEVLPDYPPEKAWAAYIVNVITGLLGDHRVYVLTEIPPEARAAYDLVCKQAQVTGDSILPRTMKAAIEDRFHLLQFANPEGEGHIFTLLDVPSTAWAFWERAASEAKMSGAEEFFGRLFQQANSNDLKVQIEAKEA